MFGFGRKKLTIVAPFAGEVVPMDQVPDPVFAQRMLGDGIAVNPPQRAGVIDVTAPIAGTVRKIFKTLHAFAIIGDDGAEVLVHIGLETVELKGEPFEALVEAGAHVKAGDPVIRVDVDVIRDKGMTPITPVVFTKHGQIKDVVITDPEPKAPGVNVASARFA